MDGLVGSTPWKPYDLSPLKTPFSGFKKSETEAQKEGEADGDSTEKDGTTQGSEQDGESKSKGSPIIHSSSPPRPRSSSNALDASPTMSRPATAVARTLSQLAAASKEAAAKEPGLVINGVTSESADQPTAPMSASTEPNHTPTIGFPTAVSTQDAEAPATNGYATQNASKHTNSYTYTSGQPNGYHDEPEDEGIDLAK